MLCNFPVHLYSCLYRRLSFVSKLCKEELKKFLFKTKFMEFSKCSKLQENNPKLFKVCNVHTYLGVSPTKLTGTYISIHVIRREFVASILHFDFHSTPSS